MSNTVVLEEVIIKIVQPSYEDRCSPDDKRLEIEIRERNGQKHYYTEVLPQNDVESRLHLIMFKAETILKDLIKFK